MAPLKEGDQWQMWGFIHISSGGKNRMAQMPSLEPGRKSEIAMSATAASWLTSHLEKKEFWL